MRILDLTTFKLITIGTLIMKKTLLTGTLLSILSFGAIAETPSFNYVDLGYSNWDFDGANSSIDGFELKVSRQINDMFYIAGDFNRLSNNGASVNLTTLGLGYMNNFSESTTFFAELDYANISPENSSSENGFEITTGIRSMLTPQFELKGAVEYLSLDNDDITSLVVGGAYNFTDTFAVYADYKVESDLNRLGVGIRINF